MRSDRSCTRRQALLGALGITMIGCQGMQGRRVDTLPVPTPWPLGPFRERTLPILVPSTSDARLRSPTALKQTGRIHLLVIESKDVEAGRLVHAISSDGEHFERVGAPMLPNAAESELLDLHLTVFVEQTVLVYRTASEPRRLHLARTLDLVSWTALPETPAAWRAEGAGLLLAGPPAAGETLVIATDAGLRFGTATHGHWPDRLEAWEELPGWDAVRPVASVVGRSGVHLYLTRRAPEGGRVLAALLLDSKRPRDVLATIERIRVDGEDPARDVTEAGGAVRFNGRWIVYAARPDGTLTAWLD